MAAAGYTGRMPYRGWAPPLRKVLVAFGIAALWVGKAHAFPDWRHPGKGHFEVGLHARYGFVPDLVLDPFFSEHGAVAGVAPGLEIGWTKGGFHLWADFSPLVITSPSGVWLVAGDEIADARWVELSGAYVGTALVMSYEFKLARILGIGPGVGYGPMLDIGDMRQYPTRAVEGTDGNTLEEREKIDEADGSQLPLPLQGTVLLLRTSLRPVDAVSISLDLGFRLYFFGGLAFHFRA